MGTLHIGMQRLDASTSFASISVKASFTKVPSTTFSQVSKQNRRYLGLGVHLPSACKAPFLGACSWLSACTAVFLQRAKVGPLSSVSGNIPLAIPTSHAGTFRH
eukprot:5902109-Amphidinium_carterae.1